MNDQFAVKGHCEDAFSPLREAFEQNFREGLEIGASVAAVHQGKLVANLWGGSADRRGQRPWDEDTIACVFSTSKIVAICCALIAIDRGLMELDQPVARYWPEFGKHGKDSITIRDALTHRALVPTFSTPQSFDTPRDWDRMIDLIANEKPWFEAGTLCYHPVTFGFIIGELIGRVTGTPIRQFLHDELTGPLNADFHFGLTDKADRKRLAMLTHPTEVFFEQEDSLRAKVMGGILPPPKGVDPWEAWEQQSAVMPASGGMGNARSVAKIGSVLAMGGTVGGRQYLSRHIVDEATREQCHDVCPLMGDIKLGLGLGLDGDYFPAPTSSCFHWGGYGGSWCVMDPRTGTSIAYVMNNLVVAEDFVDLRQDHFWQAITDVLSSLETID